jgi:hypothetical protein
MRFKTVSERNVIQSRACPQFVQGISHTLRPAVRLKRHAVVFLEITSQTIRIDSEMLHLRIPDSCFRALDHLKRAAHPIRRPAIRLQWTTPLARPITGKGCFTDV